jgi:predicted RNA-binding protein YlxR (DUF448 family)
MSPKKPARPKHIPERTCVGCRETLAKRALVRVVRTPAGGVGIDPTGKASGRGAYVHERRTCWDRALGGALASALKIEIPASDRAALVAHAQTLTMEDSPVAGDGGTL